MNDHVEIANLIYTYAERIDLGDFDGVGQLFEHAEVTTEAPDAVPAVGAAAVTEMFTAWTKRFPHAANPSGYTLHTKHVTTNVQIYVDAPGETARTRSYFTVFMQTDTLPLQPIIAGRYHDEFRKIDGAWHFTHRHMLSDLFGNLSEHLLLSLG
ncbi:MAG: nuclear transport factor 2 family protein [Acidimicrobiales bacterium]